MTVQDVEMLNKLVDSLTEEVKDVGDYIVDPFDKGKTFEETQFGKGYKCGLGYMKLKLEKILEDCIG